MNLPENSTKKKTRVLQLLVYLLVCFEREKGKKGKKRTPKERYSSE